MSDDVLDLEQAADLIASLDDETDADVEQAWALEIRKRLEEIDSGAVKPIPWKEGRRRLFAAAGLDPEATHGEGGEP